MIQTAKTPLAWGQGIHSFSFMKIIITINVPLFKKLRNIIFFCGTITLWAISRDILKGPRLFWPLKFRGQKSRSPLKMSREMAHKVIVPQKKIRSQSFLNSGTLVILCTRVLLCTVVVCCWRRWPKFLMFVPSLAVRWLAPTTHSISCLDSSLGRVPACVADDSGSIPGGGKLNVFPLPGGQVTSTHYSKYKLSR